ncbi:type II CAAX endopeptidase family protein [Nonomuraea sp. B12E4]|uniref:CPBP family intramembrane glutamic endopeptidase n=1 Tax=Nonomuraea sp. B12E4 TaxID=3153564 RepID=UPI00325CF075
MAVSFGWKFSDRGMMSDSVASRTDTAERRSFSRFERALTLATAIAIGLTLVPESPPLTTTGVIALLLVTLFACRRRSPAVLRMVLCSDLIAFLFTLYVYAGWPPALITTSFVVVPVAAGVALHRLGRLRPVAPWLKWGPLAPVTIALFVTTIVASVAGLVLWTLTADADVSEYLGGLRYAPPWQAVAAIVGFALVNAAWEELLFRGVLLTELVNTWGLRAALVIESITFGISHANGFPSGPVGVVMALAWGYLLGVIRMRTGGIGYPYAAHVAANTTIALLAYLYI